MRHSRSISSLPCGDIVPEVYRGGTLPLGGQPAHSFPAFGCTSAGIRTCRGDPPGRPIPPARRMMKNKRPKSSHSIVFVLARKCSCNGIVSHPMSASSRHWVQRRYVSTVLSIKQPGPRYCDILSFVSHYPCIIINPFGLSISLGIITPGVTIFYRIRSA